MCALVIRDDISPEELRRRARQEGDGRVAARLFAIANALINQAICLITALRGFGHEERQRRGFALGLLSRDSRG